MIVELNLPNFQQLMLETDNIFVEEREDSWLMAFDRGQTTMFLNQEKTGDDIQDALFVETWLNRANVRKVPKIIIQSVNSI